MGRDGDPRTWAHLRACVACRVAFAEFSAAAGALRDLAERPGPGSEFFAALEERTLALVAAAPRPSRRRWQGSRRRLAVVAACLACAFAGHWLTRRFEPPGGDLLRRTPLATSTVHVAPPPGGWLLPVGFTPSRQGLRGQQQLWRDTAGDLLPSPPSTR